MKGERKNVGEIPMQLKKVICRLVVRTVMRDFVVHEEITATMPILPIPQ